jgi:hypothetical protein
MSPDLALGLAEQVESTLTRAEILTHLRRDDRHVLGCWCVDLALGLT